MVMSREIAHDLIVGEIIAAVSGKLGLAA